MTDLVDYHKTIFDSKKEEESMKDFEQKYDKI